MGNAAAVAGKQRLSWIEVRTIELGWTMTMTTAAGKTLTIAVIGDIHNQWEPADNQSLENLGVDLALFVGDFGNEAVEIVRLIAQLSVPSAAICGNHDAWYTASDWGRRQAPYDRRREDRVQQQLELLGPAHVGYGWRDFPELNLSVVGARPFSWGGPTWRNEQFYRDRYGIEDFTASTAKILRAAESTTSETLIFLGHNGPQGLGDRPEDTCGRDWEPRGGDFGDPDFAAALGQARAAGKRIACAAFGHMHHQLRHRRDRLRERVQTDATGTVYVNAASVPRIVERDGDRLRNFSLLTLRDGVVETVALVWANRDGRIANREMLYQLREPAAR